MTDTSATNIPNIHTISELELWRIVPYARTLLFNFKDAIQNEDDAINAIVSKFIPGTVVAGRRLSIDKKSWLVIEVLFATEELRTQAIRQGIRYGDATIMPLTTSTAPAKYTVITLSQMALSPEDIRMDSFRHWVKVILSDTKTTKLSEQNTQQIWLETDAAGIYRGAGTVVLHGYDPKLMEAQSLRPYLHASNYPTPQCTVRFGYLYCRHCRVLDDHETADCVHVNRSAPIESVDDDQEDLRRPGKRIQWVLPKPARTFDDF